MLENLEIWLTGIEATGVMISVEVHPEDSVSQRSLARTRHPRQAQLLHRKLPQQFAELRKAVLEAQASNASSSALPNLFNLLSWPHRKQLVCDSDQNYFFLKFSGVCPCVNIDSCRLLLMLGLRLA